MSLEKQIDNKMQTTAETETERAIEQFREDLCNSGAYQAYSNVVSHRATRVLVGSIEIVAGNVFIAAGASTLNPLLGLGGGALFFDGIDRIDPLKKQTDDILGICKTAEERAEIVSAQKAKELKAKQQETPPILRPRESLAPADGKILSKEQIDSILKSQKLK